MGSDAAHATVRSETVASYNSIEKEKEAWTI